MRAGGFNVGGEQSGHIVLLDHNTTGDGLLTALQVLAIMRRSGKPLSTLVAGFERVPQVLVNVNVATKRPVEELPEFQKQLRAVESALGGDGRVLVRYSGTEPKARVMVEGDDEMRVRGYAADLAAALQRSLAGAA
jgi:phosphoglucosamine mutase